MENGSAQFDTVKESLQKYLYRHAGANRHPVNNCFDWIPAFAGMTIQRISRLIQRFLKLKALSSLEWQALLGALIMLPVVALLLRMIGYNRTMTLLNKTIPGAPVPVNTLSNPLPPGQIRRERIWSPQAPEGPGRDSPATKAATP